MTKNLVYFICILSVVYASGCSKNDSVAQAAETAAPVANNQASSTDIASKDSDQVKHQVMAFDLEGLADDGSKKWDVKGQSAESFTEDKVKLNNVTAGTYGKEATATITADAGMYDKTKNNVRLEQNVKAVIENTKGGSTDFMPIAATTPSADKSKENAVKNTDKMSKSRTTITCDAEVEFNYEKNEGYFNKNVHVINEEGTIDADRLTIYLDPSSKTVKTIVAEGNVRIKRGENTTFSDKATYIEAEKKIVLTGQPKLVIYQEGDFNGDILKPSKK